MSTYLLDGRDGHLVVLADCEMYGEVFILNPSGYVVLFHQLDGDIVPGIQPVALMKFLQQTDSHFSIFSSAAWPPDPEKSLFEHRRSSEKAALRRTVWT